MMVTYVPTILMNLINQAVIYNRNDNRYDLITTVNMTCMMVLASVYLSGKFRFKFYFSLINLSI